MTELNTEPEAKCTFCGSLLGTDRVRICPVCKSWQNRWLNYLVFLGGSAGVLALLATAITYVGNTIYTAWSQRRDAQVLELQYPGRQIVNNSGTMPLMLSHYQFLWSVNANTEPVTTIVTIGKEIEPNKVLSYKDDVELFKERLAPDGFVANADGDGTPLLAYASPDFDKCYLMVFFSQDAPELQYLSSFYAKSNVKLATAKVDKASLFYYSTNDGAQYPYWKLFDAVAAFWKLTGKANCPPPAKAEGDRRHGEPKP
jgi:hypothetical protein